jgi:hypothetical protein
MKMTVFCDVAPCSVVEIDDVSEVLTTSIIRAMKSHKLIGLLRRSAYTREHYRNWHNIAST